MEYKLNADTIRTKLMDVAERFRIQYSQMVFQTVDYQNDEHLQERLRKGSTYFARTISGVEELIRKTSVKTDNQEVKKRWSELFPTLKETVMQKRALLKVVSDEGFAITPYLKRRSAVLAGKTGAETKKR